MDGKEQKSQQSMSENSMNVGSLFSGIGGIELGFKREGFETKWLVENNPFCQAILKKHWPNAKIYGDITKIDFKSLKSVEILTGGFPCQDVSKAGKRKGMAGARSSLWKEYARAIRQIRPRYAVIENVPGLLSLGLNEVLGDLAQIGYDAEWFCLCASDFGALHRRERVFVIAYPSHERCLDGEFEIDSDKGRVEAQHEAHSGSSSNSDGQHGQAKRPLHTGESDVEGRFVTHGLRERIARFREEKISGEQGFSWCKDIRSVADLGGRRDLPEPLVRGKYNGISHWVDRIESIGNSVVPECAQFIAREIKKAESLNY